MVKSYIRATALVGPEHHVEDRDTIGVIDEQAQGFR